MVDFSELRYIDKSLSLSGMNPSDLFFSSDGLKLFVLDITSETVVEYNLSTAWDLTSAAASGNSLDFSVQLTNPAAMAFKPDGTQLVICGSQAYAGLYSYTLSVAWDISTATFDKEGALDAGIDYITGCAFAPDGSNVFVVTGGNTVYSQDFYTNWDVTDISIVYSNFDVSTEQSQSTGILLDDDGLQFHIIGYSPSEIHTYSMSSAFTAGSASLVGNVSVTDGGTIAPYPHGMFVDGDHVYIVDNDDVAAYEYSLTAPAPVSFDGKVIEEGTPVARTVRAHDRATGALQQEVTSDAATGDFTFDNLVDGVEYYIVALDDDAGTNYNAVIYDRIVGV